jgi:hypothetical protein
MAAVAFPQIKALLRCWKSADAERLAQEALHPDFAIDVRELVRSKGTNSDNTEPT